MKIDNIFKDWFNNVEAADITNIITVLGMPYFKLKNEELNAELMLMCELITSVYIVGNEKDININPESLGVVFKHVHMTATETGLFESNDVIVDERWFRNIELAIFNIIKYSGCTFTRNYWSTVYEEIIKYRREHV